MASTSQRQYWPSNGDRLTRIKFLEILRSRFSVGAAFLLLSCLVHTTVLGAISGSSATSPAFATRTYKIVPVGSGCVGFFGHVRIDLESEGNEVSGYFTIGFEPTILANPVVTLGADAGSWVFVTNTSQLAIGRIGIAADTAPTNPAALSPPDRRILNIRFDVIPGAPTGPTPITFVPNQPTDGSPPPPIPRNTSAPNGDLLPTAYQDGSLMIGGTACATSADVAVSGRVLTSDGQGLRNAEVLITDQEGNRRRVLTSSLGYYQFDGVKSGQTYVVGVASRRYRFEPRVVQVSDNLTNLDFVALK